MTQCGPEYNGHQRSLPHSASPASIDRIWPDSNPCGHLHLERSEKERSFPVRFLFQPRLCLRNHGFGWPLRGGDTGGWETSAGISRRIFRLLVWSPLVRSRVGSVVHTRPPSTSYWGAFGETPTTV